MTIDDSKVIAWLSGALISLGGAVFTIGIYLGRKKLEKLERLDKLSRYIVPREEISKLKERLRRQEMENTALRMTLEDGRKYVVIENGDMGYVILPESDQ